MTTIAYSLGIMAADRRITTYGIVPDNRHMCHHCFQSTPIIEETDDKIITIAEGNGAKFRDDDILAIGISGNLHMGNRLIEASMRGFNLEEIVKHHYLLTNQELSSVDLLIVCQKHVYTFKLDGGDCHVRRFNHEEPVAVGNGKMAAMVCMKVMKLDAVSAVAFASQVDDTTGNGIMKYDATKGTKPTRVSIDEINEISQRFQPVEKE